MEQLCNILGLLHVYGVVPLCSSHMQELLARHSQQLIRSLEEGKQKVEEALRQKEVNNN